MKTEYTIYLDYRAALRQAEALYEAARTLRSKADVIHEASETAVSAWTGSSADAYIRKLRLEESDLRKAASKVSHAADTVKSIALTTYRAEQQALATARERTY